MSDDIPETDEETEAHSDGDAPTTDEIKQSFLDAIPSADAVVCVALEMEDDGLRVTSGRAARDKAEFDEAELLKMMMAMDQEIQEQMFSSADATGEVQPIALSADELEELGLDEELVDTIAEDLNDEDDTSSPGGMFQ
jgi:hypothetical protein